MTSRASRAGRERRAAVLPYRSPAPTQRAKVRAFVVWLIAPAVLVLFALLALFFRDVPLGQGYFLLRYSPVADWRLERTMPLVLVVESLVCGAVWTLAHRHLRSYVLTGLVLLSLAGLGAAAWVWWGPPKPLNQMAFNGTSMSTDGAFVVEAEKGFPLGQYLREFPQTLKKSPQVMGGTRVLSNPPLATVLAYATCRRKLNELGTADEAQFGWLERMLIEQVEVRPEDAVGLADGLRFNTALLVVWVLAGWAAYALGRRFLSPAGAAVFATLVMFNPSTVHYSPGKDPGQLLTINLMLWAWLSAWQKRCVGRAALGGAVLAVGCTAGLVHIWVALIAVVAVLWESWQDRVALRALLRNALAAAGGGLVVCAIAYFTIGWNIPLTLVAVSRRWTELQKTFDMNRGVWYAIGLPIFLLFVSPGVWTLLGLSARRFRLNFGTRLAICTLAVMLLIYGPLGVTYELPRLWIAFLPTLTLGVAVASPLLRGRGFHKRAAVALVLIVGVQLVFTALHWTLLDAREAEYRLITNRFYN
jgi:hypothetical protein